MKKQALKSKRNRHTGRINEYKQNIIDRGKSFLDSNGFGYFSLEVNQRHAVVNGYKTIISSTCIVRTA